MQIYFSRALNEAAAATSFIKLSRSRKQRKGMKIANDCKSTLIEKHWSYFIILSLLS